MTHEDRDALRYLVSDIRREKEKARGPGPRLAPDNRASRWPRRKVSHCVYCGKQTAKPAVFATCARHRDLVKLDPVRVLLRKAVA